LVFQGPAKCAEEDKPKSTLKDATDAIVAITQTIICGTDSHICQGIVAAGGHIANGCALHA